MLRKLWKDEAGFVISAELVLVATIVVIGMIVGLVVIRNQVVQELVDVGQAIGRTCQSYSYGWIYKSGVAYVCGASYTDTSDFCEAVDPVGLTPGGITIVGPTPPVFAGESNGGGVIP